MAVATKGGRIEEDCGVARRSNCGPRTRGVGLIPDDPFAIPDKEPRQKKDLINVELSAHLPLFVFLIVGAFFTYGYNTNPTVAWIFVILAVDVILISTWPPKGKTMTRQQCLPLVFGLSWLAAAVTCGTFNAKWMQVWTWAAHLRGHTDVLPTNDPRVYADAGVLQFAEGVQLDVDGAAGFLAWPHTYCAAPIRSTSADAGANAELSFWAIGKDCCNSRGGFDCNSATDPLARSGIRVASVPIFGADAKEDPYNKAVRMAAAASGEVAAEDPVLVIWERSPVSAAYAAWWLATTFFLVQCLFAVLWCQVIQFLIRSTATRGGLRSQLLGFPTATGLGGGLGGGLGAAAAALSTGVKTS